MVESYIKVLIFILIIICCKDLDWDVTGMGIGIKVGDPNVQQDTGPPIELAPY